MFDYRPIFLSLGLVLCTFAAAMMLPAMVDLADGNTDWQVFVASAAFTLFVGGLFIFLAPDHGASEINTRTGFLLTTITWLVVTAFAAIPFIGIGLSYTDAYFETMSGLTTTGSTVLTKLDSLPRGILLWRALLQGIGGLGIVVTAIIMLPFLRVGGMQLFHTESSESSEKILPRTIELVFAIAGVYAALTILCTIAYIALGMTGFDAICHALTTLATGGFSTHDASFGFFKSPALEWTCIVFMFAGALPFVVIYHGMVGKPAQILKDAQIRGYLLVVVATCLTLGIWLTLQNGVPFPEALRKASFAVVSVITTTGFATDDYTKWGFFPVGVFFLLMFIGGCSGSTAGGIKVYRLQVVGALMQAHLSQLVRPHRIARLTYNERQLTSEVMFSVVTFIFIYVATAGVFSLLLSATGLDFITAVSSSVQAIASVGPGLGDTVGPSGNFATLPVMAKWLLSFEMLLGRLELFTVLVLFQIEFWRW